MSKRNQKKSKKSNSLTLKNKPHQVSKHVRMISMQQIHISSPIPPPEIMEAYNAIMPSAMERFFALAEKQSSHRQEIERMEVKGQNKRAAIGLYAGWSTTILLAVLGAFLLYHDKKLGAYTFFISAIVPRIVSFVMVQHLRKKQIKEHR